MPTSSGFAALGVSATAAPGSAAINEIRRNSDVDLIKRMAIVLLCNPWVVRT
jgi:hypothetical protein